MIADVSGRKARSITITGHTPQALRPPAQRSGQKLDWNSTLETNVVHDTVAIDSST